MVFRVLGLVLGLRGPLVLLGHKSLVDGKFGYLCYGQEPLRTRLVG